MPKRLLALSALLAVTTLAGCGDSADNTDATTARDTSSASTSASATTGGTSTGAGASCDYPADGTKASKPVDPPPSTAAVSGQVTATMKTSAGTFTLTLDADKTPCTVNSFVSLAKQKFFDGTSCHRLTLTAQTGIGVLQCGDPSGTGSGGPGYSFADELTGDETYPAGTLAMANAGPDTNGSQFFIVYDQTPLPADYTVFGTVDAATIADVKKVAADGTQPPGDGKPVTPVDITSVTVG